MLTSQYEIFVTFQSEDSPNTLFVTFESICQLEIFPDFRCPEPKLTKKPSDFANPEGCR